MDGQAQQILARRLSVPLRNWCVGLAITATGVIASYLWLDQPIVFFVHRNIADKAIFVWLQRILVVFVLLPFFFLAWCELAAHDGVTRTIKFQMEGRNTLKLHGIGGTK